MRIYQPARGVGAALQENSFIVIDDVGTEIGFGGLTGRMLERMYPDRPLALEMTCDAHPAAADMLFGALSARAERMKAMSGVPAARLFTRCGMEDEPRKEYLARMGFDDFDGTELFVLNVEKNAGRRKTYPPAGTKSIDVDLSSRIRREQFLLRLKAYGAPEHASEWLEERMRGPVFFARAVYSGSDLAGELLLTGQQSEAVLEMVYTTPKWRSRGTASALVGEAQSLLEAQGVPWLTARAERRNGNATRLFQRCGFDWIRTEELLLGRNI